MQNTRRNDPRIFRGDSVTVSAATYCETVHGFVRRHYGPLKCGVKLLAMAADVTVRTAENWLAGLCAPQGAPLLRLMVHDTAFRAEICALLDQAHDHSAAAARTSQAITARHRALAAQADARSGADVPEGRRLVLPTCGIVAVETRAYIRSAGYSGPDRRRSPSPGLTRGRGRRLHPLLQLIDAQNISQATAVQHRMFVHLAFGMEPRA